MPDTPTAISEISERVTTLRNQANRRRLTANSCREEMDKAQQDSIALDALADEYEAVLTAARSVVR